jgi:D-arabinose 1-dehydrogenase-like Zn-dependent alcohol dehydrogenase
MMKAAVLHRVGEPLRVEEAPIPELAADEVLVQTRTCGICRTDLHIQAGLAYVPSLPHIPGHEPAGVVVEVGPDVAGLRPGQRVVPHLFITEADCCYTRTGRHAQAMNLRGILGVTLPGGFAEYFKAPARNFLVLPDAVPFDVGGLTSCAVITAVHAYRKAALQMGDTAVVLGAGGIGLILVQLLRAAGIRTLAVDCDPASRELAVQAGAERALAPDRGEETGRLVRDWADSERGGVDCVFELVGRSSTMKAAADFVRRGGQIVVIGEEAEFPAVDTILIAQKELRIAGSRNGGIQDARDALAMLARGTIRPVIAARYPLEQINEALEAVRGDAIRGRAVVTIS